ncbi:hypothetical protein T492DRAFT_867896, partial [Pavlovales sp. CCMP2436]
VVEQAREARAEAASSATLAARLQAELADAHAELGGALADAHALLARSTRAEGVSDAARAAALAGTGQDDAESASLDGHLRALRRVCAAALSVALDTAAPRAPADAERQVARLKHRCAAHVKERAALTSILDKKVKVLVDELAKSLLGAGAAPPRADALQVAHKQVGVLQKLVHAAVAALKMPDASEGHETEGGYEADSLSAPRVDARTSSRPSLPGP